VYKLAKKKKSNVVHKTKVEHKKEEPSSIESFIPKDKNAIMTMAIFLIIGLLVGTLISFGAFSMQNEQNGVETDTGTGLTSVELSQKVESYLNDNFVQDEIVTIVGSEEVSKGLYQFEFEVDSNGELVGAGLVYATDEILLLGEKFDLNVPFDPFEGLEEAPIEEPPVETQELTEEELAEFSTFNTCLAESGMVIYGSETCPACRGLISTLGGKDVVAPVYVECTVNRERCSLEAKTGYIPEIQLNGEVYEGSRELTALSTLTGCQVPSFA
jgi:hypothetical protein